MSDRNTSVRLDPVTFEVLKNAFSTLVDEMAEEILRTCRSFVIYCRDFSAALCDPEGNTIAQGSNDIASHVGTLHRSAQAVVQHFAGDIHPGDIFVINDPYDGGTHCNDVRVLRPIFHDGELVAIAQTCGHWADIGGRVPGSIDFTAREFYGETLLIPPLRVWSRGTYLSDVASLIVQNTRAPSDAEGDLHSQAEATKVADHELQRLIGKYGLPTVRAAFGEVQDYVERVTRERLRQIPDGQWETEDFIDCDLGGDPDRLVPVRLKMTIEDAEIAFDLEGSGRVLGSSMNAGAAGTFSAVVAGMKSFFPDIPLNSGFYRPINLRLPQNSLVNARYPAAVSGFAMTFEKVFNLVIELWSEIEPSRAMACSFNIEYLEIGGKDLREPAAPYFMWYDWMVGGWGGRMGKDGSNGTSAVFGVGLKAQPVEGQERLCPAVHQVNELLVDSGGPGEFRGGLGVIKGATLGPSAGAVVSYEGDRGRSITWGIRGGLPSIPMGVSVAAASGQARHLGSAFADEPVQEGDYIYRPSAGGGGYGDPLKRSTERVVADVENGYVSEARAARDYGVVLARVGNEGSEVDADRTIELRSEISHQRVEWLREDPARVAERHHNGELDVLDLVRRYGVILDWRDGRLLPETTATFRRMLARRAVPFWTELHP